VVNTNLRRSSKLPYRDYLMEKRPRPLAGISSRLQERVETRRPSVRSGSASLGTRAVT
jgi:hypothetical protein